MTEEQSLKQSARKRHGNAGEELAAGALRRIGVEMVEQIGTPVHLITSRMPGAYKVIYGEKVSGDHRGIIAGSGRSVLAETKTIWEGNLTWSALRPHQPGRLTMHHELGGISLLVWVHHTGVYIMRWPIEGFSGSRSSISAAQAAALSIEDIRKQLEEA